MPGPAWARVLLAALLPVVAAAVWGAFLAPRASRPLPSRRGSRCGRWCWPPAPPGSPRPAARSSPGPCWPGSWSRRSPNPAFARSPARTSVPSHRDARWPRGRQGFGMGSRTGSAQPEQAEGVEVGPAAQQPPVQAGGVAAAVTGARREGADRVARRDDVAATSTVAVTGSYVVRRSPCVTVTTPRPATGPANVTTPAPAATTVSPGTAARSTPRWPGSQRCAGGSKPRTTRGVGGSGQRQRRASGGRGWAVGYGAPVAAGSPCAAARWVVTGPVGRWPRCQARQAQRPRQRRAGAGWQGRR